jgi:murein DD-endopeptidase MepM/ murein hydrolase activator NlpD
MVKTNLVQLFKKYGYYVVGGCLLLAIAFTLSFVTSAGRPDAVIDVSSEPLSFRMPMNELSVIKHYSDTELLYNKTLNQWEAHKAYNVTSPDLKVFAVARGVVAEVGQTFALGNFVVITHEDGLKTVYGSLAEDVLVSVGTNVQKGQLIGLASDSAGHQSEDGNHLHFEIYKDNAIVNPSTYLNFDNK